MYSYNPLGSVGAILFVLLFFIFGIVLIIGTYKRWIWLVDPPEKYSLFYSQSWLKKVFGKTFLIYYNYILGYLFVLFALIAYWNAIKELQRW
jgi:hypothetical protein